MMDLTTAVKELHELKARLQEHKHEAEKTTRELLAEIVARQDVLTKSEMGIDADKVALAKTIIYAGNHRNGGADWRSCVSDAIKQLATGEPVRVHYGDLWRVYFGTKNYEHWVGQRSDHDYGFGPKHGGICFSIGVTEAACKRGQADLRADEVEACIYYLTNLKRIQEAESEAAAKVA